MIYIKNLGLSLAVVAAFGFSGCGGSSDNNTTAPPDTTQEQTDADNSNDSTDNTTPLPDTGKKITGSITGNGYAKNNIIQKFLNSIITPVYADDLNKPDKIVVMYDNGESQKEFTINPDGSFEIDTGLLDKNDLVLLVVNSASKKVFGHLNLGTTSNAKLDFIDKSKLADNLDLGSIDTENNCSTNATVQSVGSFSSDDVNTLESVALVDDALVMVQNKYKNPTIKLADVYTSIKLDTYDNAKDNYSTLDNVVLEFVSPELYMARGTKWDNIAKENIELYPPSTVVYNTNKEANATTPMQATYKNENEDWGEGGVYNKFRFYSPVDFPRGEWILKIAGSDTVEGVFTFNGAYPKDENGAFVIPLPKVKFNMEGDIIKSIDVKWYIYDTATNQFKEASEDVLNSIMKPEGFDTPYVSFWENGSDNEAVSDTWNGHYTFKDHPDGYNPTNKKPNIGFTIGQILYRVNLVN